LKSKRLKSRNRQEKDVLFHAHAASFFRFLAAHLSLTRFAERERGSAPVSLIYLQSRLSETFWPELFELLSPEERLCLESPERLWLLS